jgi:hypothetical protein
MTHLTPHFTLEELTHTDHRTLDNVPTEHERCIIDGKEVVVDAVANLPRLADFLEQIKVVLGNKPIMVNSGFRSEAVNNAVGSSNKSDHRRGCAADIRVPGMTPDQVVRAIIASGLLEIAAPRITTESAPSCSEAAAVRALSWSAFTSWSMFTATTFSPATLVAAATKDGSSCIACADSSSVILF